MSHSVLSSGHWKSSAKPGWLAEIKAIARHGKRHPTYLCVSFVLHFIRIRWILLGARIRRVNVTIIAVSLIENFGDIVACEPVVRYLRQSQPNAFIVWLVRKPFRELVEFNPDIDKVVTLFCLTEWIWLSRCKLFDVTVDLHMEGRVCQVCAIPLTKRGGNQEITHDNYYHFGGLLSAFSQSAGLPALTEPPRVYIPDVVRRKVDGKSLPQRFVVFHCNSKETIRDWLTQKWQELAGKMISLYGVTIVEIGTKSELAQCELSPYINLCNELSLLETAEVIRRSSLFVGIDSGPAHFANALGVRGVVLLGFYHQFKRYLPYTGNYADPTKAELVYGNGPAASIEVERVLGVVERQVRIASDLAYSHVT